MPTSKAVIHLGLKHLTLSYYLLSSSPSLKSLVILPCFFLDLDTWPVALCSLSSTLLVWEEEVECGKYVRNSLSPQFLALQNIFLGEDIRKQLPNESTLFDQVNSNWKSIMDRMSKDSNALRSTHYPGLSSLASCPSIASVGAVYIRSHSHMTY